MLYHFLQQKNLQFTVYFLSIVAVILFNKLKRQADVRICSGLYPIVFIFRLRWSRSTLQPCYMTNSQTKFREIKNSGYKNHSFVVYLLQIGLGISAKD